MKIIILIIISVIIFLVLTSSIVIKNKFDFNTYFNIFIGITSLMMLMMYIYGGNKISIQQFAAVYWFSLIATALIQQLYFWSPINNGPHGGQGKKFEDFLSDLFGYEKMKKLFKQTAYDNEVLEDIKIPYENGKD